MACRVAGPRQVSNHFLWIPVGRQCSFFILLGRLATPIVGVPFENCPTDDLNSGQELAKHVLPVCVSMVGPEGFEPPTKRL